MSSINCVGISRMANMKRPRFQCRIIRQFRFLINMQTNIRQYITGVVTERQMLIPKPAGGGVLENNINGSGDFDHSRLHVCASTIRSAIAERILVFDVVLMTKRVDRDFHRINAHTRPRLHNTHDFFIWLCVVFGRSFGLCLAPKSPCAYPSTGCTGLCAST